MFNLTPQERNVILFILAVILIGVGVKMYRTSHPSSAVVVPTENQRVFVPKSPYRNTFSQNSISDSTSVLVIHIAGAVNKPGVYDLPHGTRILNAVQIAGDTTGNADISQINYAEPLHDGEKITIPFLPIPNNGTPGSGNNVMPNPAPQQIATSEINGKSGSKSKAGYGTKININTAGLSELEEIPGVGPATAQAILNYRTTHGRFNQIEDIRHIKGIGVKKFESMRDVITVY
jgi:competence protein ComEA